MGQETGSWREAEGKCRWAPGERPGQQKQTATENKLPASLITLLAGWDAMETCLHTSTSTQHD